MNDFEKLGGDKSQIEAAPTVDDSHVEKEKINADLNRKADQFLDKLLADTPEIFAIRNNFLPELYDTAVIHQAITRQREELKDSVITILEGSEKRGETQIEFSDDLITYSYKNSKTGETKTAINPLLHPSKGLFVRDYQDKYIPLFQLLNPEQQNKYQEIQKQMEAEKRKLIKQKVEHELNEIATFLQVQFDLSNDDINTLMQEDSRFEEVKDALKKGYEININGSYDIEYHDNGFVMVPLDKHLEKIEYDFVSKIEDPDLIEPIKGIELAKHLKSLKHLINSDILKSKAKSKEELEKANFLAETLQEEILNGIANVLKQKPLIGEYRSDYLSDINTQLGKSLDNKYGVTFEVTLNHPSVVSTGQPFFSVTEEKILQLRKNIALEWDVHTEAENHVLDTFTNSLKTIENNIRIAEINSLGTGIKMEED